MRYDGFTTLMSLIVLTYTSDALEQPLHLAGQPVVHLYASTCGSDRDWIVKLIDVRPDEVPGDEALGGYQLLLPSPAPLR